jgi:FkbM family methyltransferase
MLKTVIAKVLSLSGKIPLLNSAFRTIARIYIEGSIVAIRSGVVAGYKWKRHHRFVNGYWLGIYELPLQQALVCELRNGDVFYDIGANAGFFSLVGAYCVGNKGCVFAFEPLPSNAEAVEEAFVINGLTNCHLIRAAVTNHSGEVSFSSSDDSSTAHITSVSMRGKKETFNVPALTLDEFIQKFPSPNLMKIDVEGAELLVLKGAEKLLRGSNPPKLIIEVHTKNNNDELLDFLLNMGYHLFTLKREPLTRSDYVPHHLLALSYCGDTVKEAL